MITTLNKSVLMLFTVFTWSAFAINSKVTIELQAKDLALNSTLPFKAGTPIKLSGADKLGKNFDLEITSAADEQGVVKIAYKLDRGSGDPTSGSMFISPTETVKTPTLTPNDVQFDAKLSE